jgi:Cu2+-containing amine oxidase
MSNKKWSNKKWEDVFDEKFSGTPFRTVLIQYQNQEAQEINNAQQLKSFIDQKLTEQREGIIRDIESYSEQLVKDGAEEMNDVYVGKLNAVSEIINHLKK